MEAFRKPFKGRRPTRRRRACQLRNNVDLTDGDQEIAEQPSAEGRAAARPSETNEECSLSLLHRTVHEPSLRYRNHRWRAGWLERRLGAWPVRSAGPDLRRRQLSQR